MILFDRALLALAVGLTLSTVYLFASDYPGGDASPSPLPPLPGRAIVLHDTGSPHRQPGLRLLYHGVVSRTALWSEEAWKGTLLPHTARTEINEASLSIGVDPDFETEALLEFLTRLCREYHIPSRRILAHEELEKDRTCHPHRLDMKRLREVMKSRLGETDAQR